MKGFAVLRGGIAAALMLCLFAPPLAAKEPVKTETPALWKIQGPKNKIYLLGSMHALPQMKWRSPAINKAFNEAEIFIFEVDMQQAQDPRIVQPLMVKYGLLPQGETLQTVLPKTTYEELERVSAGRGIPVQNLTPFRPWLAALTISLEGIKQAGYSAENGVDFQAESWARANNKMIGSLETLEAQLRIFGYLPPEHEIEFLTMVLAQEKDLKQKLSDMTAAYAAGDVVALEKVLNSDLNESPSLRNAMLKDRHEKWLPKIEKMMNISRDHMIVVGAAHLVGPDSIVAMLRAKGIKVEGP